MEKIRRYRKYEIFMTSILLCVVSIISFLQSNNINAYSESNPPFTLELPESAYGEGPDYVDINMGRKFIKGSHIGIKLNIVDAKDKNGNTPVWTMLRITFFSDSNEYSTNDKYGGNGNKAYIPACNIDGSKSSVTWMYNYLWPNMDFYGTMYIPWAYMNGGTDENPTKAPEYITKVRIQHNSDYESSRRFMLTHFFSISDAVVNETQQIETIGDVKILENFETEYLDVKEETEIFDFCDVELNDLMWSSNKSMNARFATSGEVTDIEQNSKKVKFLWKSQYSLNGQKFTFDKVIINDTNVLCWTYGSYYDEYIPTLNSYGSLGINLTGEKSNFKNAKGLTLWCKNPQNYPISFNFEFSEVENGGMERWNLNGGRYRTVYLYDIETGEEYSISTHNVIFVPSDFVGWIRVPFSQYECPSWSMAKEYVDGVYDENKLHTNLYITSQFIINDGVTFFLDNLGLYYSDFSVGRLFDNSIPSIKQCLEGI